MYIRYLNYKYMHTHVFIISLYRYMVFEASWMLFIHVPVTAQHSSYATYYMAQSNVSVNKRKPPEVGLC